MQKRSREQWQALLLEQVASGFSAQQFCRDKKLCTRSTTTQPRMPSGRL